MKGKLTMYERQSISMNEFETILKSIQSYAISLIFFAAVAYC